MKQYTYCAECGEELGERIYTYFDNFLRTKYFEEPDGSDNAFCSDLCALAALMCDEVDNVQGVEKLWIL
jgi:hypothetical protein